MAGKNTIKGLTIELGADTTKLGKALQNVEDKSRDLSGELGQINKLLKLDPGNTELLAQKQKVLADAVANTSKKLETLKEAERQVQKQFERGEVSEEQVRALQREIIATEKKLKGYENAIEETNQEMRGLDDSTEKVEGSTSNLGETLANAAKVGMAAVATAATAVVGALVGAAEATREYRTEMAKLDTAFETAGLGVTNARETYTELVGVLGDTDQAVEAANHLAKLAGTSQDLAAWTEICTGIYATFGASLPIEGLTEAANETAKVGQVTGPLADALNWAGVSEDAFNESLAACADEQERVALITQTLTGLYDEAAKTYQETNAEVIRANIANDMWMESLAGIGAAFEPVITDVKKMGASLLSEFVPGVEAASEAFRGMMNGDEGAASAFGDAIGGLITGLLDKITELLPTVLEVGASIVTTLVKSLVQQIPALLAAGGQIISNLLSGIATNLPNVMQSALDTIGGFVQGLQTNLPLVLEKGRELLLNLANGIRENLPSLISQALDIIMNFAQTIYDNAPTLIQTGFEVLSSLISGIMDSLPTLIAKVPEIISTFANTINDNFPTILAKGVQLIGQIIMGIIKAIPTLIANIPKIITAIVDVWEAFNWLNLGKKAITFLKDGVLKMVGAVKSAGKTILTTITDAIKNLPGNLLKLGKNAISDLGGSIRNGLSTVKSAATSILNGVLDTIKGLPSKMLSVGTDLVKGLWNGISDMTGWVIGKIQGFGDSILGGIKSFFGIKSPSRVFRDEVGAMLAEGMAEGIEENADAPLDAMAGLSNDLLDEANSLNGLTLERKMKNTFEAPTATSATTSLAGKLDLILAALERGQIITIDGKQLIGATADGYDNALGQRRVLAARGAR